ncbi:MAG: hypothetical protein KAS62_08435 [Candidatus Delongbacteria bacterium]|nr:hypothetical protein [Candidatus Delongbacteria bacterium]
MKKIFMITIMLIWSASLFSEYTVGATVLPEDNLEWTTSVGHTTTLFEQTAQGKAVMLFFGQTW